MAARKILINDDTMDKFSFMLPGKGNSEVDEIKGMYHVDSCFICSYVSSKTMFCHPYAQTPCNLRKLNIINWPNQLTTVDSQVSALQVNCSIFRIT
jgi:hypothetical protein